MLVATPEAVRDVIAAYAQVRSVFMLHEPLAALSFGALLGGRTRSTFTQSNLAGSWKVSQSRVSKALEELRRFGCVREANRDGRQLHYELTGAAKLALGHSG